MPTSAPHVSGRTKSAKRVPAGLDGLVGDLRMACVTLRANRPVDRRWLAALLGRFETALLPHFAAEQTAEYFGSLVAEKPRFSPRIERLRAEHAMLASTASHIVELAGSDARLDFVTRLERFLDAFEAHEHDENALMQEFFSLDEGDEGGA